LPNIEDIILLLICSGHYGLKIFSRHFLLNTLYIDIGLSDSLFPCQPSLVFGFEWSKMDGAAPWINMFVFDWNPIGTAKSGLTANWSFSKCFSQSFVYWLGWNPSVFKRTVHIFF
jgi:hypothetical protein